MAKQDLTLLFKIGKGTTIIVVILFAIFSPFFIVIRKEEMVRELSRKRELLNGDLLKLKSQAASVELRIGQLSSAERLETFAVETLGMAPADPQKVIAVQRGKDGKILVDQKKSQGFLFKLMGKPQ